MNTLNSKNNNNSPIGFFDSGVGGLTVLNKVKQILPNENFIYYGDTLHMPYGDKSKSQLLEYSKDILEFFEDKGCKAVVMACNTTSSTIYNDIKNDYDYKLYPIVQSVAKILAELPIGRLGIFATRATIESGAYQNEIFKYNSKMKVFGQYCPKWVHIVENSTKNTEESRQAIKADLLKMLENNPEKIVLGCTHYPFLTDVLSEYAPADLFLDPAVDFAKYIKQDLERSGLLTSSVLQNKEEFYVSANPEQFKISAQMFYELKSNPELLTFKNLV